LAQFHILKEFRLLSLFCRFQLARWASVPLPFHMDREAESYHGDLIE
jgi:hypothetical protein